MRVQVKADHYQFESYDNLQRWSSYWYQLKETLSLKPKSVLEIGTGSGVCSSYLRGLGVEVKTLDIDDSRKPDFVGSVDDLDQALPSGMRFDAVCAFQVLEHLPHDRFDQCLAGLSRRAPNVLLSLPHFGFAARFSVAFAGLKVNLGTRLPKPFRFTPDHQHQWELDFGRHSVATTTREIERYFQVVRAYHVKENPYHYLWVLRSRSV